jgi:hypothetical protein
MVLSPACHVGSVGDTKLSYPETPHDSNGFLWLTGWTTDWLSSRCHGAVTGVCRKVPIVVVVKFRESPVQTGTAGSRGNLRYGLVRDIEGQPPKAIQRRILEQSGCDLLLEEGRPTRAALRAQRDLLYSLKYGDELLVCSLNTLQMSTGELVLLFRKFDEAGVVLRVLNVETMSTVEFSGSARRVLALMAANEALRPTRQGPAARSRPTGKPLSRYQIDYAMELKRQGASLRTISLLFQTSPNELQRLMQEGSPKLAKRAAG